MRADTDVEGKQLESFRKHKAIFSNMSQKQPNEVTCTSSQDSTREAEPLGCVCVCVCVSVCVCVIKCWELVKQPL